jgi:hypothetical protein
MERFWSEKEIREFPEKIPESLVCFDGSPPQGDPSEWTVEDGEVLDVRHLSVYIAPSPG